MKARLAAIVAAVVQFMKTYPAAVAAVASIVVDVAAKFGLNLNSTELLAWAGVAAAVAGLVTHLSVMSKPNVDELVRATVKAQNPSVVYEQAKPPVK